MFLALLLVALGIFLLIRNSVLQSRNKKEMKNKKLSEGEVLKNKYIIDHEQKMKDDSEYEEYLEWCKFKGEMAAEKEGYDKHRMEEYHLYKKLMKHGIGGL